MLSMKLLNFGRMRKQQCHSDQGTFLTPRLAPQPFLGPCCVCRPYLRLGLSLEKVVTDTQQPQPLQRLAV